ncbi:hypothetical protein GCM10010339_85890 [Streptomyces alanosinicus]|uniref:Uncharacterized protein n=1 Tax=Streptomyces alanosinicus TaxID=68171 RepID=A0A918YTF9_9ACTN|nr:hypothetical protein GCM10010339_85890 [Streptomyces alanosinicus]
MLQSRASEASKSRQTGESGCDGGPGTGSQSGGTVADVPKAAGGTGGKGGCGGRGADFTEPPATDLTPPDRVGYGGGGWADGATNQRDSDNYPFNGSRGGLARDGARGGDGYVLITWNTPRHVTPSEWCGLWCRGMGVPVRRAAGSACGSAGRRHERGRGGAGC